MYYAKVNWYNDHDEKDVISHMMIPAADYNEAMQAITSNFRYINSLEMKEVDGIECKFVFIPESCVEAVIAENDPY